LPNDYVKIGKITVDFERMVRQEECKPVLSGVIYAIYATLIKYVLEYCQ